MPIIAILLAVVVGAASAGGGGGGGGDAAAISSGGGGGGSGEWDSSLPLEKLTSTEQQSIMLTGDLKQFMPQKLMQF